jgi:hypothetical protein
MADFRIKGYAGIHSQAFSSFAAMNRCQHTTPPRVDRSTEKENGTGNYPRQQKDMKVLISGFNSVTMH